MNDRKKLIENITCGCVLIVCLLLFGGASYIIAKKGGHDYIILILLGVLTAIAVIVLLRRIFSLTEENEELRLSSETSHEQNDLKTEFLSNISHGIRTPLNAILGYTGLAIENNDDREAVRDYLSKINASGNHLLDLINDILEMNSIETGHTKVTETECSLKTVADDLEAIFASSVAEKKLLYLSDLSAVTNTEIWCDELKLKKILINLLSNAVRFTPEGGTVELVIRQRDELDDFTAYDYEFIIKDTGIGMTDEQLKTVFEPFRTVKEAAVDSAKTGTGLGLAITKELVQMLGGHLSVSSTPGEGTEYVLHFTFHIQVKPRVKAVIGQEKLNAKREAERIIDFTGKRALIVDDNQINREIAGKILTSKGFAVDMASDGSEAVAKVLSEEQGAFDVVLMDIQMPVMNGYDAAQAIRELNGSYYRELPIVAMTAQAFYEDREAALKAGMNGHVSKPIDVNHLFEVLKELLPSV